MREGGGVKWGTWEELVLACAVKRHGTGAWECVSAEISKRISAVGLVVTPEICENKYLDLQARYSAKASSASVLEYLTNKRVQELRTHLKHHDASITSLQLKVKRLKEEGEYGVESDLAKTEEKTSDPDPEPEDRSVNESNSTDTENKKPDPEPSEPERDYSCNGSSDSVEKKPALEKVELDSESSLAVDKGDAFTAVDNCDESQPLVKILEMVKAHKVWPVFQSQLSMQEAGHLKVYIRQPMDIETIHKRLEEGCYSNCSSGFFRDLLLLFNNATLSFGKSCPEFAAAIELRNFVSRVINERSKNSDLSAEAQPISLTSKPEPEPELSDSLVLKPKTLRPIVVCRKRSSIAGKASGSSSGKMVQNSALLENKSIFDWKPPNKCSVNADEAENTKKQASERFVSSSNTLKKDGKTQDHTNLNISELLLAQNQEKDSSPKEHIEPKSGHNCPNLIASKRRNTTSGTKNKQNSSTLLESLKDLETSPNNSKEVEITKPIRRGERKRYQKGQQAEEINPIKRNNGRVGKRGAARPPSKLVSGKRRREVVNAEVATSRYPKKPSRRGR